MSISASLDGAFSAPTRMWASYGGEWREIACTPPVSPPRELTITLKGTPGNGTIEVGNVEVGGFYSLYSRYGAGWKDLAPRILATKTATSDPLVFSASDLDPLDRPVAASGWRSGIYTARGAQARLGDESPDLAVAGEARLDPKQVVGLGMVTKALTIFDDSIKTADGTAVRTSSSLKWVGIDLAYIWPSRSITSMKLHAQKPDAPTGWTIGPATHMRATQTKNPTASKFNVLRTGGTTVGGKQTGEALLTGGLNYNAWVPVSAAWDTPPYITIHNYPANGWVVHPDLDDPNNSLLQMLGRDDGAASLEFAAASTTFVGGIPAHQVAMVQTDPRTITVSGPANVTIWVVYLNPLYSKSPRNADAREWHNVVIEVVLDGSGSGTITAADFDPLIGQLLPGDDRVPGGRYIAVNAVRGSQVLASGPAVFQPTAGMEGRGGSVTDFYATINHTLSPGTTIEYASPALSGMTWLETSVDPAKNVTVMAFGSAVNLEDAHIDPAFEITDRKWALLRDDLFIPKYLVRYDSHSASYIPPPTAYLDLATVIDPGDAWWQTSPAPGGTTTAVIPEPADWGQGAFWVGASEIASGYNKNAPETTGLVVALYVYEVGAKDGWSGHVYP